MTGVVIDGETSAGISGGRVVLADVAEVRTTADGRFVMRNVPAGTRQLEIFAVGRLPVTAVVDVVAHDSASVIVIMPRVVTLDSLRVIAPSMAQGEAAGIAGAMAARTRTLLRALDVAAVQDALSARGAFLGE